MFTLIALGTGAAYFYSVVVLLFPGILPKRFAKAARSKSISRRRR